MSDSIVININLSTNPVTVEFGAPPNQIEVVFQTARDAYQLAVVEGFEGTRSEWLESLNGTDGDDGREVELSNDGSYVKWRYVGTATWTNLIAIAAITGSNGTDGTDGTDGREIELSVSETHVLWRYVGEADWTELMALTAITGPAGADALPLSFTHSGDIDLSDLSLGSPRGVSADYNHGIALYTRVRVAAGPNDFFEGPIVNLSGYNIEVLVDYVSGTAVFGSWVVSVAGERGATGSTGNPGSDANVTLANVQTAVLTAPDASSIADADKAQIQQGGSLKWFSWANIKAALLAYLQTIKIVTRLTTEQMRLEYNGTNYMAVTVGSTGGTTFSNAGTATDPWTFSGNLVATGTACRLPNQTAATSDSAMTRGLVETFLMDNDVLYICDHFLGGGSFGTGASNTNAGDLQWTFLSLNGTNAVRSGWASQQLNWYCNGDFTIQTGANKRDGGIIYFAINGGGGGPWLQANFNTSTIIKVRFRMQSTIGIKVGLMAVPSAGVLNNTRILGMEAHPQSAAWQASTAYALGDYVRPTVANGRRYYATVAGTTGGSQPTWPTSGGGTVTDGGVTWKEDGRDGIGNFMFVGRDNADALTGSYQDSGVAVDTAWHVLTMRCTNSTGTQWALSIDGSTEKTITLSTTTLTFGMQAFTHSAAQAYCVFDYFKMFQRVMP